MSVYSPPPPISLSSLNIPHDKVINLISIKRSFHFFLKINCFERFGNTNLEPHFETVVLLKVLNTKVQNYMIFVTHGKLIEKTFLKIWSTFHKPFWSYTLFRKERKTNSRQKTIHKWIYCILFIGTVFFISIKFSAVLTVHHLYRVIISKLPPLERSTKVKQFS